MLRLFALFIAFLAVIPTIAFAQGTDIYGSGAQRIQLIKDVSSVERTLGFGIPGASGEITALPELQVISVTITATNGWVFDFRYSPMATNQDTFDLANLGDEARQTYAGIARGASALAGHLRDKHDFAPFCDIFVAIAENRGIVTARRDRTLLAVAQYKETERRDAATMTDIEVAGRELHLRQSPLTPGEFDVVIDTPPGSHSEFKIKEMATGVSANVFSPGLQPDRSLQSLGDELAEFMRELLPVLIVASDNNYKISPICDELAAYEHKVEQIADYRGFEGSDYSHSCYEPEPEYSAYTEPAPGYSAYIQDEDARRLVYYYRSERANGFILQDSFTNYSRMAVTASKQIFDPTPYESERLPMPDVIWEETYPREVNEPFICPGCARRLGGINLSSRDLFIFEDSKKLFATALEDEDFRESVKGDLILGLRKYMAMSGEFTSEEQELPLISLRYRETEGLGNAGILTYRDANYLYQISVPPRNGFVSFAFSFEQALAPEIWRFYLAPAGEYTQLVMSYPVQVPLGQAERRFNRSASALASLYRLSKYMARYDSILAEVPPIIEEIWAEREKVGPKMFIRQGTMDTYTDWLSAGFFANE